MKKSKKIILIVIATLIVLVLGFLSIRLFKKTNVTKEEVTDQKLLNAISLYMGASEKSVTSIPALIANGFYEGNDADKTSCKIIEKDENDKKFYFTKEDCELSNKIKEEPIVMIKSTKDLIVNNWSKKGGRLTFEIVKNDEAKYTGNDVTSETLYFESQDRKIEGIGDISFNDTDMRENLRYVMEFKNGEYRIEKKFSINIDVNPPKLINKTLTKDDYSPEYEDFSSVSNVFIKVTDSETAPSLEEVSKSEGTELECNKTYYVWSYASDIAGNDSDIELAGSFTYTCN